MMGFGKPPPLFPVQGALLVLVIPLQATLLLEKVVMVTWGETFIDTNMATMHPPPTLARREQDSVEIGHAH